MRSRTSSPSLTEQRRTALAVLVLALGMLPLLGCGGGARPDFQLNSGEVYDDGPDPETAGRLFGEIGAAEIAERWTYRVTEGDQLEVVFFTHPEQNRFVTVRPDGKISLPYLGDVSAVGRTPEELAHEIQGGYETVLVAPRVDVIVQELGARYYVLGEVRNPGEYPFDRKVDVLQALTVAGGYANTARLSSIVVLRRDSDGEYFAGIFNFREFMEAQSRLAQVSIHPGDMIWVPKDAISRWDNAVTKSLRGVSEAQDVLIKGWQLFNLEQVYQRRF